jgi:hypothetical protein
VTPPGEKFNIIFTFGAPAGGEAGHPVVRVQQRAVARRRRSDGSARVFGDEAWERPVGASLERSLRAHRQGHAGTRLPASPNECLGLHIRSPVGVAHCRRASQHSKPARWVGARDHSTAPCNIGRARSHGDAAAAGSSRSAPSTSIATPALWSSPGEHAGRRAESEQTGRAGVRAGREGESFYSGAGARACRPPGRARASLPSRSVAAPTRYRANCPPARNRRRCAPSRTKRRVTAVSQHIRISTSGPSAGGCHAQGSLAAARCVEGG